MRSGQWSRITSAVTAFPILTDAFAALGLLVVSTIEGFNLRYGHWRHFDALAVLLTAFVTLPNVWRRHAPMLVLLFCSAVWLVYVEVGYPPVINTYGVLLAIYTVTASRPFWTCAAAVGIGCSLWVYGGVLGGQNSAASLAAASLAFSAVI
jgi:hypothetical protein